MDIKCTAKYLTESDEIAISKSIENELERQKASRSERVPIPRMETPQSLCDLIF